MYTQQPKKLMIVNILDILRRYSDEDNTLSQKDIADKLKEEYDMTADRKAVRRNIMNLIDSGYPIEYTETVRMVPVKDKKTGKPVLDPKTGKPKTEENCIWSDFYYKRDFTDGELRLLIDSVIFSKHIPYNQCRDLVKKLEGLSNVYFKSHVGHIARMSEDRDDNQQLFWTIEQLDKAISENRKVSFKYTEYGTDKKVHVRKRPDGSERVYVISPYQMAAKEGKYYLICNYDKYDDISNYRLDRIRDLEILDDKAKPFEELKGSDGRPLDLAEYMKEHVYMYSSDNVHATFRIPKAMIGDVIDMFGMDVRFFDEDDNNVSVSAKVNELSMVQFAKSYAPDVILLEPKRLADQVKNDMKQAVQEYDSFCEGEETQ